VLWPHNTQKQAAGAYAVAPGVLPRVRTALEAREAVPVGSHCSPWLLDFMAMCATRRMEKGLLVGTPSCKSLTLPPLKRHNIGNSQGFWDFPKCKKGRRRAGGLTIAQPTPVDTQPTAVDTQPTMVGAYPTEVGTSPTPVGQGPTAG